MDFVFDLLKFFFIKNKKKKSNNFTYNNIGNTYNIIMLYIKRIKEQLLYCITIGILYHHNIYYKKLFLHFKKKNFI